LNFKIDAYGLKGVFSGGDINYYYQGLIHAAHNASFAHRSAMIDRIVAHNVAQYLGYKSEAFKFYNIRQIGPGIRWANVGFKFYLDNK